MQKFTLNLKELGNNGGFADRTGRNRKMRYITRIIQQRAAGYRIGQAAANGTQL
jgi:hypothetical protein